MVVCTELIDTIGLMDIESALYETGMLLKKEQVDTLLESWVYALAMGARKVKREEDAQIFRICLEHLWELLLVEHMKVKDCFCMTVQLCLLMKRMYAIRFELMHINKHKTIIQKLFPEKAQLSDKGMEVFRKILPPPTHETYALAVRIAAGFTRLWDEHDCNDSRMSLEYLSRRNLEIKNTYGFVHESDDVMWFLWGVAHKYFGQKRVEKCWDIFYWNYQNKLKADRLGFLWVLPWYAYACAEAPQNSAMCWEEDELRLLEKVRLQTRELWKQLDEALESEVAATGTADAADMLMTYMPRATVESVVLPVHEEQPKQIKLGATRGMEKQNKDKDKVRKTRNETDPFDPRNLGFHFGRQNQNS